MPPDPARIVAPGGVVGIIGGGQLGRMTALAAARLGYRCHIFCPEADSPAALVSAAATIASYDDEDSLSAFASGIDVVTFEFENIPASSVRLLAEKTVVRPGWRALETSQDRTVEKRFLNDCGIPTAPWRAVSSLDDLNEALALIGRPAFLKTARFGYDGKGQVRIDSGDDAAASFDVIKRAPAILEGAIDYGCEISVIAARSVSGQIACFDATWNRHKNSILNVSRAPAPIPAALEKKAHEMAKKIAETLDIVGLLALELFVTKDGNLLANEIAPRPHNSGHWTMDAGGVDQFEQFVRAVAGLPLAPPTRLLNVEMTNLIGDDVNEWPEILQEAGARLHLYGKSDTRPGRKMGHVNRVFPLSNDFER